MKDEVKRLEFYGGSFVGFLPAILYMTVAGICTIGFKYYSLKTVSMGAVIGILIGFIFCKDKDKYWNVAIEGVMDRGHGRMRLMYMIVGVFTAFLSSGQIGNGFVWLSQILNLKNGSFVVFSFISSTIISMGCGQPITALFTVVPIMYPPGLLLGANPKVLLGALLSGLFLGDTLSPSSQVTVVAATTQQSLYNPEKETNNVDVIKGRLKYILPIALLSALLFYISNGNSNNITGSSELLSEFSNPKGLLMLIPLSILIIISFKTRNVFLGLSYGIFTSIIIGIASGLIVFSDILHINNGVMGGILFDGFFSMSDIIMSSTLLFAIIGIMKQSGAISDLGELFRESKASGSMLGTELIISLGISLVVIALAGATVPGILVFGSIANEVGQKSKIDPIRRTNLLVLNSYHIPVIFPLSSSFIMGVLTMLENLSLKYDYINLISPFDMFKSSYFNLLLLALSISWVFFGVGRKEEVNLNTEV